MQSAPPKWTGTWKLNREKSNIVDPKLRERLQSLDTAIVKFDPIAGGVVVNSQIVMLSGNKLQSEVSFKFGVKTSYKDMSPIQMQGTVIVTSVTVTSVTDNRLEITSDTSDGFHATFVFEVSNDGNTLNFSAPWDQLRVVYDKQ